MRRWRSKKTEMPLAFTRRFLMAAWNKEFMFVLQVSQEGKEVKWMIWSYDRVEIAACVVGRARDYVWGNRRWIHRDFVVLVIRGEACMSPENVAQRWNSRSVSERDLHRSRHSQFWGWRKVVPVCGVLNLSNSYSTGNPWSKRNRRKGPIN